MKTRVSLSIIVSLMWLTAFAVAQKSSQVLGKTNLHGWIDDAPALPNTLDEAVGRKNSNMYATFYERVEAFKKSYRQSISTGVSLEEPTLNNIPAIAQMGGMENLARMTPEQRAQAA